MTNTSHWPPDPVQHLPGQCQQSGCSSMAVGAAYVEPEGEERILMVLCADGLRALADHGVPLDTTPFGTPA